MEQNDQIIGYSTTEKEIDLLGDSNQKLKYNKSL